MNYILYLGLVVVFLFYLLSANYLFNVIIKAPGEVSLKNIDLPEESDAVHGKIEEVTREKLGWKAGLKFKGYVFKMDSMTPERVVYLVLKAERKTLILPVLNDTISRPDISASYFLPGNDHHFGFEITIPAHLLPASRYRTGLCVKDDNGIAYAETNQEIIFNGKRAQLSDLFARSAESIGGISEVIAKPVSMRTGPSDRKMHFFFDMVKGNGTYLNIRGWGFFEGRDLVSLQHYIVLQNGSREYIFDCRKSSRKDIAKKYLQSSTVQDSCGFTSIIPTEIVEPGNYQLGLYITKDHFSGFDYYEEMTILVNNNLVIPIYIPIARPVPLTLHNFSGKLNYTFEMMELSDRFLTISGWGYLIDPQTMAGKYKYILLRNENKVVAYNVVTQLRPDITRNYGENGLNLDSSGYASKIPIENLEKGRYQVGLYLKNDNESGFVFSDKFIDIKE